MPVLTNPIGDVSQEVLRFPAPVILSDLAGNSYTLSAAGGIPVTPTGGLSLVSAANTGIPAALPAIVQKASAVSTGSVASITATFANSVTAGNSIIVVCGVGNNSAITVSDSLSNTYNKAVNVANSTTFETQISYAVGIAGGANTVTVAATSASIAMQCYEVSGLIAQAANVLGQSSSGTGTGTTASASNIAGMPNTLAFAGVAVGTAAQAVTASSGTFWTADSSQNSAGTPSGLFTFGALSLPLGNMGSTAAKATLAGSEPWAYAVAVFKPVLFGVQGAVTIEGYNKTNMTSATTTLVKTGPGTLHAVAVNKLVASATIELDDALTNTNPFGIITLPGTVTALAPFTMIYDAPFATGLSVTTSGATDITLIWR